MAPVAPLKCALGLMLLLGTVAWSNDPLTFVLDDRKINQPVDHETWCGDCFGQDYTTQEPWVTNPTECMWDLDDEFRYTNVGNVLNAGATASVSECLYKGTQLVRGVTVLSSPSPALVVTYSFTWAEGSESYVITPTFSAHRWHYDGCIAPRILGGTEVEVPGSHGGTAVPVQVTVTVHNPTTKKITQTGGGIDFGWVPYFVACS